MRTFFTVPRENPLFQPAALPELSTSTELKKVEENYSEFEETYSHQNFNGAYLAGSKNRMGGY